MPDTPDAIVPSQNASMSFSATPADAIVSVAASVSRSSTPLSQRSPNGVHPIPTIATRSRMPLLLISSLLHSASPPRGFATSMGFAFQK